MRKFLQELVQRRMDEEAAIGRAGIGIDRVERLEIEDMLCVDRVGITQPRLDLGNRKTARPGLERRPWFRWIDAPRPTGIVEPGLPGERHAIVQFGVETGSAQRSLEPQQPT